MTRFNFTNIFTIILIILTVAIGPIILFAPFFTAEPVDAFHYEFFTGLFEILEAETAFNFVAPVSKPFLIAGFVISLLTIINMFEYEPKTAKIPYWLHRLLRGLPLIGSILGLTGALLQIKIYQYLVANFNYHNIRFSVGFYLSVILFGLIFLGFIVEIIQEEIAYSRWKIKNRIPYENP